MPDSTSPAKQASDSHEGRKGNDFIRGRLRKSKRRIRKAKFGTKPTSSAQSLTSSKSVDKKDLVIYKPDEDSEESHAVQGVYEPVEDVEEGVLMKRARQAVEWTREDEIIVKLTIGDSKKKRKLQMSYEGDQTWKGAMEIPAGNHEITLTLETSK